MPDALNPRKLTRAQLAQFLPTHELIKAFESLFSVTGGAVDEIDLLTVAVNTAQDSADTAQSAATVAAALAQLALVLANDAATAPPIVQLLAEQVDDLTGRLCAAEAQITALALRCAALEERPTP